MPVERPTFHESWYRVADIHPRLRFTVQISRQHFRGQPWHVVQDHTNNAFFRLAEPAYRFIGLLDGKRTVADAWKVTNEQLGDDAPTQGEVIQLLGQLYTANLLQAEVPPDTHTLFGRYKKRKQREISSYLMNIMFARIPLVDPDQFLNKWLPLLGWIFSPLGFIVWVLLFGFGLHSIMQVPNWTDKILSRANGLLSPDNLVMLYVAFAFIKACHEMGHAIACKKFGRQSGTGGEVHIIGIMFLVFTPVPYVDASSSWALTNKWHRAIVGAAGMWVELAIASIAAMVWAGTNDAHWLHAFAYNIMFVASFSTIVFNANPLLRYDGYYILADLLEIPNLATRAKDYIFYLVKRYAWNVRQAHSPAHAPSERFWLFFYAIASFIMRCFVTFSIMFYLSGVLNGTLIILATAMAIAGLFTWALMPLGKFVHYVATNPELGRVRTRAILTSASTIAVMIYLLGAIKIPDYARAQGVVEPDTGYLRELFVSKEGMAQDVDIKGSNNPARPDAIAQYLEVPYVHKEDQLLKVVNLDTMHKVTQLHDVMDQLVIEQRRVNAQDIPAMRAIQAQIDDQKKQIEMAEQEQDQLTLRAPIDGILVTPMLENREFGYLKPTDRLGAVADMHHLIIRAAASNDLSVPLREEFEQGQLKVEMRVNGRPDILLTGDIAEMNTAGSNRLPSPALGYQVGGLLNTATDDRQGTETVENFFEIRITNLVLVDAPPEIKAAYQQTRTVPLLPGQRVIVRFNLTPKPIAVQIWTKLRQVFQKKFQL